jgi:hypothetical protein
MIIHQNNSYQTIKLNSKKLTIEKNYYPICNKANILKNKKKIVI